MQQNGSHRKHCIQNSRAYINVQSIERGKGRGSEGSRVVSRWAGELGKESALKWGTVNGDQVIICLRRQPPPNGRIGLLPVLRLGEEGKAKEGERHTHTASTLESIGSQSRNWLPLL